MANPAPYQNIDELLNNNGSILSQNIQALNTTIQMYRDKVNLISEKPSDFSNNLDVFNKHMSLTDVMSLDTNEKLLQQNTMYIMSSLTAVTMLITDILIMSK